jgi:hypothetical protein
MTLQNLRIAIFVWAAVNASELLISFVDGSMMKVKIVDSKSVRLHEGAGIRQISEDQTKHLFKV